MSCCTQGEFCSAIPFKCQPVKGPAGESWGPLLGMRCPGLYECSEARVDAVRCA
jgi:hypothetical protein